VCVCVCIIVNLANDIAEGTARSLVYYFFFGLCVFGLLCFIFDK